MRVGDPAGRLADAFNLAAPIGDSEIMHRNRVKWSSIPEFNWELIAVQSRFQP